MTRRAYDLRFGFSAVQRNFYVRCVREASGCSEACGISVIALDTDDGKGWEVLVAHRGDLPCLYRLVGTYRPTRLIRTGLMRDLTKAGKALREAHAEAKPGVAS